MDGQSGASSSFRQSPLRTQLLHTSMQTFSTKSKAPLVFLFQSTPQALKSLHLKRSTSSQRHSQKRTPCLGENPQINGIRQHVLWLHSDQKIPPPTRPHLRNRKSGPNGLEDIDTDEAKESTLRYQKWWRKVGLGWSELNSRATKLRNVVDESRWWTSVGIGLLTSVIFLIGGERLFCLMSSFYAFCCHQYLF